MLDVKFSITGNFDGINRQTIIDKLSSAGCVKYPLFYTGIDVLIVGDNKVSRYIVDRSKQLNTPVMTYKQFITNYNIEE